MTLSNYYEEVLREIENLMNEENWEEADKLITQELAMPYVPGRLEGKLQEYHKACKAALAKEPVTRLMSPEEIRSALTGNQETAYMALEILNRSNIRNYLEVIQDYLSDEDSDRLMKALLIQLCQRQQVSEALSFTDQGITYKIIPVQLHDVLDDVQLSIAYRKLEQLFENDNPSFLKQCQQVLIQYAYKIYPLEIEESGELLALRIAKYVFDAYGDREGFLELIHDLGIMENKVQDLNI